MSTYFVNDFSSLSGWTQRWNTTPTWTAANPLQIPNGVTNDWAGLTWDTIDGDSGRADVEVLVKFTTPSSMNTHRVVVVRGSGADESAVHVHFSIASSFLSAGYCNGSDTRTNIQSYSKTHSSSTTYWMRCRVNTTGNTVQAKTWTGAIGDEPGSWEIDTTSSVVSAAGWVGLNTTSNVTEVAVSQFGVGTSGDTAPSSGGSSLPTLTGITLSNLGTTSFTDTIAGA